MKRATTEGDARSMFALATAAEFVSDGHCSVFAFTTCWAACLWTIGGGAEEAIMALPSFPTLAEAVRWALRNPTRPPEIVQEVHD